MKVVDIAAAEVNVDQLKAAQKEDESLDKLRAHAAQDREFSTRGDKSYVYSMDDDVLYRTLKEGLQQWKQGRL